MDHLGLHCAVNWGLFARQRRRKLVGTVRLKLSSYMRTNELHLIRESYKNVWLLPVVDPSCVWSVHCCCQGWRQSQSVCQSATSICTIYDQYTVGYVKSLIQFFSFLILTVRFFLMPSDLSTEVVQWLDFPRTILFQNCLYIIIVIELNWSEKVSLPICPIIVYKYDTQPYLLI